MAASRSATRLSSAKEMCSSPNTSAGAAGCASAVAAKAFQRLAMGSFKTEGRAAFPGARASQAKAAVHLHDLPVDELVLLQKLDRADHVLDAAQAAERRAARIIVELLVRQRGPRAAHVDEAERYCVDAHPHGAELARHGPGQAFDPGFGGAVGSLARIAARGNRAEVDDRAAAATRHARRH